MRVYLTEWFLYVPAELRAAGGPSHDRGRKAHCSQSDALAHYVNLVAAGEAAVDSASADTWDHRAASLQHVELQQLDTKPPTLDLVVALLDDLWATPHLAPPKGRAPHPWRDDATRQPWATTKRVLRHWSAPRAQDARP